MTVLFRPRGDLTKAPKPRSDADTALYEFLSERTGLAIAHDPEHIFVDYEDWMEPACMLEQAIHSGLEIKILPHVDLRSAVMSPTAVIPGKPCRDFLIGRQKQSDMIYAPLYDLGWPSANEMKAEHYAELAVFWKYSGRKLALADMPGDRDAAGDRAPVFGQGLSSTSLGNAMASLPRGEIIVKQVYPGKSMPLLSFTTDKEFSPTQGEEMFMDEVGLHFARFEGDPAALLVQEKITMTHETRFFVISGKVITGAACIESHTPMQTPHWDDVLPPVWELARNSGEMDHRDHTSRKRTALSLWQYAWDVADEIANEAPELDAYTLDVALNANGDPVVIELNPASNAGLYANNAIKLFDAIHAYAESAPHRDAASCQAPPETGVLSDIDHKPLRDDQLLLADDPFED